MTDRCENFTDPDKREKTTTQNENMSKKSSSDSTVKKTGKRGRRPSKVDVKVKLERSRQSARECRARKKLRYQYLEELVNNREKAVYALRSELEQVLHTIDGSVRLDKYPTESEKTGLAQETVSQNDNYVCGLSAYVNYVNFVECWSTLPEHIIVHIFSFLPLEVKYNASVVCTSWNQCFNSQYLWRRFGFQFYVPDDKRFLRCLKQFGQHFRQVSIELDQSDAENRENACAVINSLALTDKRRLNSFRIKFMGENPRFYAGQEFVTNLKTLFGPPPESVTSLSQIKCVDLSGLMAAVDEEVLDLLSANNEALEELNIQIKTLVCKIGPECMVRLIGRCRSLKTLKLYHYSVTEDVLLAFTEEGRVPLEHLAITCRGEEKYGRDLSSDVWSKLVEKLPDMRVTLGFDPTCPLHKVSAIMKPEIPVSVILFETNTRIYEEVNLATAYYKDSLEKILIITPTLVTNLIILK